MARPATAETAPDRHPAAVRPGMRLPHVDSLKVALTCGVIIAHSSITYGGDGSWFYLEPGEPDPLRVVLGIPLALASLFGMGLFFFLAGCFVPASFARKGPGRFLADRWLRLGTPVLAFALFVVPAVEWAVARATGSGRSLALRPAPVAAWAKLLVLAPAAVAGSFLLAAALLRIPATRRVL